MLWFNYVGSFSDGVQKVGVTSQPFYRLQDHLMEATRHGMWLTGFNLSWPSMTQQIARDVKKRLCDTYSSCAMPGHHDWFRDPPEIAKALDDAYFDTNPARFLVDTASQYDDFCLFAKEIGWYAAPIKPATATRLAMGLVRPHSEIHARPVHIAFQSKGLSEDEQANLWADHVAIKSALWAARIQAVAV